MRKFEEILGLCGELVIVGCVCAALGMAIIGLFSVPATAAPVEHTTINRAEFMEDSGDSELAHIKFANAVGRMTGWDQLSMDEQAVRVKLAGLIIEEVGKTVPKSEIIGAFTHSFLRQMGVQMQVQAMHHLDEISPHPVLAAAQSFLVGL